MLFSAHNILFPGSVVMNDGNELPLSHTKNLKLMKLYLCTAGLLFAGWHTLCAQVYRGFNINATHFATLNNNTPLTRLKDSGANVIRLSFGYRPLVNKTPPYEHNPTSFEYLENALDFCEANDIRVIINPHTTPGTADNYTMNPTDPFWTDPSYHTYLYNLWETLAVITKDRGDVIYGLDLLNEPALPCCNTDLWNQIAANLTAIIRAKGNQHPIIIEPFSYINEGGQYISRINSMPLLTLPEDDNLIVSPHFYVPNGFTHQGVGGSPDGQVYPGTVNGVFYDKDVLKNRMQPIVDFQNAHNGIRILLGEFSAARAGGSHSDVYVNDVISLAESYGWDWAYHEFRGAAVWDAEMPVGTNNTMPRDVNEPRMQTLISYFELNDAPLPVRWISFEGHPGEQRKTELMWKTEETNVSYYEIERSANARDFRTVGIITANGAGSGSYRFTDPVPVSGTAYYRIRQIDPGGAFSHSRIISVTSDVHNSLFVYPNPVKDHITVELGPEQIGDQVRLVSTTGIPLQEITIKEPVFTINLDGYPAGMYLLHTAGGKVVRVAKE